MKMGRAARKGVAGIIATVIMFAILFTIGGSYFIFVEAQNSSYTQSLITATNKVQGSLQEHLSISTLLEADGDLGFYANNPSSVTVNMTAALVISSAGLLLKCDGVGFPAGAGCSNSTPALWAVVTAGGQSPSMDTGYLYAQGTTVTLKVLTAKGNTYSATYPAPASQSGSSQSVSVSLDNLKWVQLIPQASSLAQKKYVSNCNSASCSAAFGSSVTAGNILVDAVGWANQAPPSGPPTDTQNDRFTLGASSSVAVPGATSMVQTKFTANCNAATCGLAFSSSVTSGNTLVFALGWANQSPPSSPTDTLGDSFTLGASTSETVVPPAPALVQDRYNSNCNSATCSLAYSSSVTAGNTLVYGLGWYGTAPYVPVTVTNCAAPLTLGIDGSANGHFSSTNSGSVTLTTSKSNDVVVLGVADENSGGSSVKTVSSVSGGGLSWSKDASSTIPSSPYIDTEVWYAVASSPLSSASITVTVSGSIDDASLVAFGVSGANTTSPWDPNSSLPAAASSTSSSTPSVSGVSTTNANDMVIGINGIGYTNSNSNTETAGSGFTLIQDYLNTGATGSSQAAAEYEVVGATLSSASVAFGVSNSNWIVLAAAIEQGSGCGTPSLGFDGSTGANTEASSVSAGLTTASSNDVIILSAGTSSSSASVSSVSDTGGHTWTHRSTETGSPSVEVEEWYTIATSPLSSDSITVTWSASGDNTFSAFGISGANTSSPFDTNSGLPAVATNTTTTPSVSVSTSNANDFVYGLLANEHTSYAICHTETDGTGFTDTNATQCALGSNTSQNDDQEYQVVTSTQSNLAVPFTTNSGGSNQWAMIGDAVVQATGSATPNPFQEMVTWDPATYSTYESNTLGNIRFCSDTACATPLYSWLESCASPATCSSSSTSATAWVKLTFSIASGGSTTIYMVFEAASVNFDDNYWGEAPQLSSTYGQYDNGANVFTFYDNFAGTSLSSKWTNSGSNTVTVNNGLTIAKSGSSNNNPAIYTSSYTQGAGAVDFYGTIPSGGGSGSYSWSSIGAMSSSNLNNNMAVVGDFNGAYGFQTATSGSVTNTVAGLTFNSAQTYSILIPSSSPSSVFAQDNYGGMLTSSTDMPTLPQPLGFEAQTNAVALGPISWIRDRAYPPNGVMPTTSFGSTTTGNGSPSAPSDTLGDSFTLGVSSSVGVSNIDYYSYVWYATASSTGADTISVSFPTAVTGSESIYELAGYTAVGAQSSTGSSASGSTSLSVTSFTPASSSFVIGNAETASSASTFTAGTGYSLISTCSSVYGCSEYLGGSSGARTVQMTLGASAPWVESAISFPEMQTNTYYSYMWYTTARSTGGDTISARFGSTVAGSVSVYEVSGVTTTGLLSSTGGSTVSQTASSVTSIAPAASSVVIGNTEAAATTYTAGSGYTLSGSCGSVSGCGEYQTGVGSATTVPFSISPSAPWVEAALAFAPTTTTYYSYIWYTTAGTSGADTITTTFGASVAGSVSLYEITGFTTSGVLSSTGSLSTGSTTASVTTFTPASDSFTVGAAEGASGSTTFTATSGFTLVGTCNSVGGCSEYNAGGGGSASTVPITLGASTPWVEAALSFSTPFNPQSGIQVGGYPTMGVASGASIVWEVTFTNVDPQHRAITVWPQTELAVGSAEWDGFDTDYMQAHYFIIDGLNAGSTTVTAYTKTNGQFVTLPYGVPTTLYFAATLALGSTTQAFGTNVLTPFESYIAVTGIFSDTSLLGETIPYPYGIITQSNEYTTPTAGSNGATVTVSCTSPCHFSASSSAMVGWINSAGVLTQVATFTTTAGGNIPSGVTFTVPTATAGYYTIEVTDYTNSVFSTFQHT